MPRPTEPRWISVARARDKMKHVWLGSVSKATLTQSFDTTVRREPDGK